MELCGQAPAVWSTDDEAALLEIGEGLTEASVVDAQLLSEGGTRAWFCGVSQGLPHGLSQWRRQVVTVVEFEPAWQSVSSDQAQHHGIGCWCGAMLYGELDVLFAAL